MRIVVNHLSGHWAAADLPHYLAAVIFIADVLDAGAETEPVQFIGNLLVCVNALGPHLKKAHHKSGLLLVWFENKAFAVSAVDLFADVAIWLLAHPVAELCVADFRPDHAAHNVTHFVFGAFCFQILRLLRRIELAPVILKAGMLQGVDLLLADNAVHVDQIYTEYCQLLLEGPIVISAAACETVNGFDQHHFNALAFDLAGVNDFLHGLLVVRGRLHENDGFNNNDAMCGCIAFALLALGFG
ncbi:MAG TPA: hypothetical protein VLF69_02995 [Candidatus Saccharimonadales bacterium]|nr:hypothetical protein [Candidatus Saccharimonadales bacterium]